jgi:ribonuclease E
MSKELYVTSTPHETKLAVVEDDQLVEVFFERENEYTLAGSIYKGRVTRVLPGMQSAFVEIGLERDAFLYVTDFLEEVEDQDDLDPITTKPGPEVEGRRPEPDRRPDSEGRSDYRRNRRLGRQFQNSAPIQENIVEAPEVSAGEEADVNEALPQGDTAESVEPSSMQTQERGPRRWRGRRGRRRGRGGLETKFAEQGDEAAPLEYPVPPLAEDEQSLETNFEADETPDETEEINGSTVATQPEPMVEAPNPRPVPRSPQPIVLPGESLAKFNRKVATEPRSEQVVPVQSRPESRFAQPLPRPSTEVSIPAGISSPSLGVLPGESLSKYRNRPAPVEKFRAPVEAPAPSFDEPTPIGEHSKSAPEASVLAEETDTYTEVDSDEKGIPPTASHLPIDSPSRSESREQRSGPYSFSPGSGVVEEEEIDEEEHEHSSFQEQLDETEFEELEEETLEHKEDEMIAVGEGLAEALAQSRVEEREPESAFTENVEETAENEIDEDEEDSDEELSADEEEIDEAEEAHAIAEGQSGEAILDPEDPNYAGRAETRSASGTAGFQQRTERTGFDRKRGNRNRKGGRPPMRRGGPRRNTPRGPLPQINELLKEGQEILVQIAKEPMAKKGARITSHIALPGRFLVFMPTVNHTGVSRKIGSEEERQRLKRILISEKGQSTGGFIVRTAAAGASEEDLRADIRFLINLWNEIKQRAESSKAPALIYHDLNLVERILRDQVTSTFTHIWVDTEQEYERILRFASRFQPSLVKRVKLYTKDTPLFEQFNIQEEINKALKSKVWLKSGGYIVINQTEALVAIDINTGKYVGKTARLEDTIVKTNIDAIKEIVRQIRLRDLGGIIIIDFIDMDERKNRQKVMQALEEALKSDRSPSKVLQFNDFGLVAITRKRVKQSLERTLSTPCTYCSATGMIKSVATICNEIYVEMRKMNKHLEGGQVMLRVNPEVAKALKENSGRWLVELEELTKKSIIVKSDPAQHQEQFDIQ